MNVSVVDLRYNMKNVLQALDRSEEVKVHYHGKLKALLVPCKEKKTMRVQDHPAFGMYKKRKISVEKEARALRADRTYDI
ncbi:MAG: type II toxin-antitoxin system Phd/YefM family antitoxin [Gammaproteobacteria bacterium]|nr:type II toxin-antitoxin system Phd/YefM family antitoxin [Gammaproteobacteria bacterium]